MKLKEGILINKIENDYVLVDIGLVKPVFNGMIKLNKTSKEIVDYLKVDTTIETIINELANKYNVSIKEVTKDVKLIINKLKKNHILIS